MTKTPLAIVLIALAPLAGACASASATSKPVDAGLLMPPAPPHVIPINAEPVAVEPVADVPASPGPPASRPPARPPAPKPSSSAEGRGEPRGGEAKPEPPAAEAPAASAPPSSSTAAPQLRTAESNGADGLVRATIDRTRGILNGVDYRRLSNARKKAYDDAKRFAQEAEDALKTGNTMFAQSIATKAETLARALAGK